MEKEHRQLSIIIAFALSSPTQNHASRSKACALEKSCFVELDTGKKTIGFDIFAKGLWLNLLLLVQSLLLFCVDLMYGESFADKNFSGRILCSGTSNASKKVCCRDDESD
jgi:hypothetical protein